MPENKKKIDFVYQFNNEIGNFEKLELFAPDIELKELLIDDFILIFVDSQNFQAWLWCGYDVPVRMKFIASKVATSIRDSCFINKLPFLFL